MLLLGNCKTIEAANARMDAHILALAKLLKSNHEAFPPSLHAPALPLNLDHWNSVPRDARGLVSRRALLLLAFYIEPEIANYFSAIDSDVERLVKHLVLHVLSIAVPQFISGMCQDPQEFCNHVMVHGMLWPEPLQDI